MLNSHKIIVMTKLLFLIFCAPILVFGQNDYNLASKKTFKEANTFFKNGENTKALALFKTCVKSEPKFAEAYLNISIINYINNNFDDALKNGHKALALNKVQPSIYSQLGKIHFITEQYDSSTYYFQQAQLFGSSSENTKLLLANSLLKTGDNNAVLETLTGDFKNAESFKTRGNANLNLANYSEAKKDFNKAIEINPTDYSVYHSLAKVNLSNNNPDEALININKGIDQTSGEDKVAFLILKGNYFHEKKELDKAEQSYDKAFLINPNNTSLLTNQAAILIDQSKFDLALTKCTQAIDIDPSFTEAFYNRGIAYEMLKQTEEACSDWEEAFILGAEKAEEFLNSPTCNE